MLCDFLVTSVTVAFDIAVMSHPNPSQSVIVCVTVAFDIIDVNKSGSLDKEEMSAFLKCLVQSGPAAAGSTLVSDDQLNAIVDQAFTVIDANKDEKIEFEEFAKWASSAESGAASRSLCCSCEED